MPRPRKCRNVCCLPEYNHFGPFGSKASEDNMINMTVDEYETIRLIDIEELTQEECSIQMNVARTTIQMIYTDARQKLAESLVNGKVLQIEGGEYRLCDGNEKACCRSGCCRKMSRRDLEYNKEV
jgi:predicted DNA-binding protein (UPF0251 family)